MLDTRSSSGAFVGQMSVSVPGARCAVPVNAQAYLLNATVIPQSTVCYLSLWPDGEGQPPVSTLNTLDGAITSNMAIAPTSNGAIDVFGSNNTNLVLDIFG